MTTPDASSDSRWRAVMSCWGTAQDRGSQYRFLAWTLAWAVTLIAAKWTLRAEPDLSAPLAWCIAAIPCVASLGAVLAYVRFLRTTDELARRIQLEGVALGFAGGVIFAAGYPLLEMAGAPALRFNDVFLVMMFGWMLGQFLGAWRYR